MEPDARAIEEAKRQGDGWVYVIDGNYAPDEAVPAECIIGAWKVEGGQIVGDFIDNPRYVKGWPKQN